MERTGIEPVTPCLQRRAGTCPDNGWTVEARKGIVHARPASALPKSLNALYGYSAENSIAMPIGGRGIGKPISTNMRDFRYAILPIVGKHCLLNPALALIQNSDHDRRYCSRSGA